MNEEHEGKRKNELTWKINRIHWEKNRFIYDLMYVRKVKDFPLWACLGQEGVMSSPCRGLRTSEQLLKAHITKHYFEVLCGPCRSCQGSYLTTLCGRRLQTGRSSRSGESPDMRSCAPCSPCRRCAMD